MLISEQLHYISILIFSNLLYVLIPTIAIPLGYIGGEDLALSKMSKVYNVDFSLDPFHLMNLLLGYLIGSFFIAYVIKDIFHVFFLNAPPSYNPLGNPFILDAVAFSSVTFCFASRIVSKQHGYIKGRHLFSYLSSMGILMFFITTSVNIYMQKNINLLEATTLSNLFTDFLVTWWDIYYSYTREIFIYFSDIKFLILICSMITASFGELFILSIDSHFRSIPTALEKFPSDFELIPTNKLPDVMINMTNPLNTKSLKIASRSLVACEILYKVINKIIEINHFTEIIIIAPEFDIPCIELGIKKTTLHIDIHAEAYYKQKVDKFYSEKGQDLIKRYVELKKLVENNKKFEWVKKDLNDFRVMIVNDNKLLLIVNAGDDTDIKVGLYTEEPYVVKMWVNIFDNVAKC